MSGFGTTAEGERSGSERNGAQGKRNERIMNKKQKSARSELVEDVLFLKYITLVLV
jgi:hypothetical protein